jgi:predicted ABC-type sugar transport system permease subunit
MNITVFIVDRWYLAFVIVYLVSNYKVARCRALKVIGRLLCVYWQSGVLMGYGKDVI